MEKSKMLLFDLIQELLYTRSIAESKITNKGLQVLPKIIKILKYEDNENYENDIEFIDDLLCDISLTRILPRGKFFKSKEYYSFIFEEHIQSISDLEKYINRRFEKYEDLKVIRPNKELFEKLKKVYTNISNVLANDSFETIRYYL